MISKILVPVRGDGKGENILAHAVLLATRYGSHVQVTHCHPRPEDLLPYGVPIPAFLHEQFTEQTAELYNTAAEELKKTFLKFADDHGLTVVDKQNGGGASISWAEKEGKQIDVIKQLGRLSDLIVVAKPDRDKNLGANTLKTSLFNTGRPVLMCPERKTPPTALGEHVAIAWNGSLESVRAVTLGMDILQGASAVTILTADHAELHSATADELVDYLAVRGIKAGIETFKSQGKVGPMLLEKTAAVGADMMIMGAYGESHERETMFGGNTQAVVDNATIPVLMVY